MTSILGLPTLVFQPLLHVVSLAAYEAIQPQVARLSSVVVLLESDIPDEEELLFRAIGEAMAKAATKAWRTVNRVKGCMPDADL